ncbi:hypothetical protein Btru_007266 [Bulinus truncatus]|nr:hypothetical protein Btru_007266 [Bulinus truncatus]
MQSEPLNLQRSLSSRNHGEWLQIQRTTFTNWVNEGLRPRDIAVEDIRTDFADGVKLVALVESLTRQRVHGSVSKPNNDIQKRQNITISLDELIKDGVRLVNIDSSHIFECNLKLILALVWQLILKYQVGLSGPRNKSWILKWLSAVIPECNIQNFTTDWNSGLALHALLDFCKPGLSPNWRTLDPSNNVENCRSALKMALQNFNIPMILRPEDLASSDLDEKSAITYLSYFIKVGGPGYDATLQRVSSRTQPKSVTNFTSIALQSIALQSIALQSIALQSIAFTEHCVTEHCITEHCITEHCVTEHCVYRALRYRALHNRALHNRALRYRALRYRALRYRALRYRALLYRALRYRALRYRALLYRALRYIALHYRASHYRAPQGSLHHYHLVLLTPLDFCKRFCLKL